MISGIDVLAYNINIFVTRIPVGTLTVIDSDKIVTAVCIRKLVIKVFPQLFVSVGTLCAPPEPTAGSFVQGSPYNRYACFFKTL